MILRKRLTQGALILALLVLAGCNSRTGEYSLLFGGDIILGRAGEPLFSGDRSGLSPWGDVLTVQQSDPESIFVANLESPFGILSTTDEKADLEMNICAPVESVKVLEQAGLDFVTFANNHAQDCLRSGTDLTIETLALAGIANQGSMGDSIYQTKAGKQISFIALDDITGEYDLEAVKEKIKAASAGDRLVVVSIHWGMEYQAGPDEAQEKLAEELVDAGADIIWGHHPHVLQRMEWLHSTVDGHEALVMYSLGNLVSDQWMLPDAQRTALVRVDFRKDQLSAGYSYSANHGFYRKEFACPAR